MLSTPTLSYIDIGRVLVLLVTFAYASRLDIKNRKVPHKTWILPLLFGILFINLQLYFPQFSGLPQTSTTLYSTIHLIFSFGSLLAIIFSGYKLWNQSDVHPYIWAIPFATTIAILLVEVILNVLGIIPLATPYMELITIIFSNILLATIIGLILHLFPLIGMGGADFMAIVILGVLLPTRPELGTLPYMSPPHLPFPTSLITLEFITLITNTGFFLILYLPTIPIKNYFKGTADKPFLTAFTTEVPLEDLHNHHGRVIATWDIKDASFREKLNIYFTGIDTFFIRDYLEWRQTVSDTPPETIQDENSIHLKRFFDTHNSVLDIEEGKGWATDNFEEDEEFLQNLLQQETVRLMPGLPFIVPLFGGLLLSLTIGDVMLLLLLALN